MGSTGKDDEKDEKERMYAERILFSDNSPCSKQVTENWVRYATTTLLGIVGGVACRLTDVAHYK